MNVALEMAALTIAVIIAVGTAIVTLAPTIEKSERALELQKAKEMLEKIDKTIRAVAYESEGSKRTIKVNLENGKLMVSPEERSIKVILPNIGVHKEGLVKKEGRIAVSSGSYVHAYENDINNDGKNELILENEHLLFAVEKLRNETINLRNFIIKVKNKETNEEFRPQIDLFIENTNVTYGYGYTSLTQMGDYLTSASIKVVVKSTYNYEILFTLQAGAEFINAKVYLH